jgi:hypothetical protein
VHAPGRCRAIGGHPDSGHPVRGQIKGITPNLDYIAGLGLTGGLDLDGHRFAIPDSPQAAARQLIRSAPEEMSTPAPQLSGW